MTVGTVVVAAGLGERLGEPGPKALVELAGRPLLVHSLTAVQEAGLAPAVVVHTPGEEAAFEAALAGVEVAALVAGGMTRTDSVRAGIAALAADVTVVAVHDAARPLMPPAVIRRTVEAVEGDVVAAAPAIAVADTLKRVTGASARGAASEVLMTVDRAGIVGVQTPQVFPRPVIELALDRDAEATDDLALVEALVADGAVDGRVVVVAGSRRGSKVTYPDDLLMAEMMVASGAGREEGASGAGREEGASGAGREEVASGAERGGNAPRGTGVLTMRIGNGLDVHPFSGDTSRPLVLAGVEVPGASGLAGHSDADVAAHAVADALLGACALGDLGSRFGVDRPETVGADSLRLLSEVVTDVADAGYDVGNVDLTIVAQHPRLAAYREAMRTNLAQVLHITPDRVSVKATTTDRLGALGREEGIGAWACCTVVHR